MARKQAAAKQSTRKETSGRFARLSTSRPRRQDPSHEAIAVRAYELYLGEGGGDEVSHWLQAERELAAS